MKLIRAQHLGQCFGVRDAIALARAVAAQRPVTVLGELVHNETVLSDLRSRGVRLERDLAKAMTETVVLTAHGTSERRRAEVSARGHQIVDATCPLVRVAHQALAELVRQGLHPVVIGQRGHVEVCGLTEDFPGCDIVLSEADVARLTPRSRFGVVSQTTQPLTRVHELLARLRQRFPNSDVVFRNTVCQPTQQRQTAAEQLAHRCDVVVVIGGAHSNNTRELVNTSGYFCDRVYHIQNATDLDPRWFLPDDTIGLTAGTSTPDEVIQAVERRLQKWCDVPEHVDEACVQLHTAAA
ncbi:MAG TPA: 4-hydroxy-3-methylbut-2-enyl diphosphate reductase [Verrucomicrobiota bacterium]|nr:4-hydroxy-3-methylbut-2-enyl diphosphate reductase [Verrucomicrobiales bacterium]HRI16470.1 4-hydroxy-3-methylbut-2-enyl diphosphate reductase [Verrucomicrobiota bacterium]